MNLSVFRIPDFIGQIVFFSVGKSTRKTSVFNWNHFEIWLLNLRINFFLFIADFFVLIVVVFMLFLLHYVSPEEGQRWNLAET